MGIAHLSACSDLCSCCCCWSLQVELRFWDTATSCRCKKRSCCPSSAQGAAAGSTGRETGPGAALEIVQGSPCCAQGDAAAQPCLLLSWSPSLCQGCSTCCQAEVSCWALAWDVEPGLGQRVVMLSPCPAGKEAAPRAAELSLPGLCSILFV